MTGQIPAATTGAIPAGAGTLRSTIPPFGDRPPAPLLVRLAATGPAYAFACLVASLPTAMLIPNGTEAPDGAARLLLGDLVATFPPDVVAALTVFIAIFAAPVAVPTLLVLAARNVRGVGIQVGLGTLATLPAIALFLLLPGVPLPLSIVGTILAGGALGGLAASSARDGMEMTLLRAWLAAKRYCARRRARLVATARLSNGSAPR